MELSEHTLIYQLLVHMCHIWAQFMAPENNDSSNIRDHWALITVTNTIIMKKLEMWHRDTRWANDVGKMALIDLLTAELPQTFYFLTSLVVQTVKCLPTMQETRVQCLGRVDPLEKEMATHSSILTWKIPWTGEPGRLQSMGSQRVWHNWATFLSFSSTMRSYMLLSQATS